MRWRICAAALTIAAVAALAACTSEPTGASAPSFLRAAIAGSKQAQYDGSGTFQILPARMQGARFSLHSRGVEASADQGFAFHAMDAPMPGEYPIGERGRGLQLDPDKFYATYWHDEGNLRTIFKARSGTVRISESTPRRVAGSFQITATLLYVCTLSLPAGPGQLMDCKPAQEEGSIEITGSFDAGPIGGENPGLIPSP